ncbi:hypothetical protein A4X13_0g7676 [Tilletia indica]|uniref:Uncharacterized protein n=1 Tax=Tilletia indica TaxID=43049 RepID=A0A177T433_9BASI|nr:hypothetical protein A4X13_0g7676 [Tilletia indica]
MSSSLPFSLHFYPVTSSASWRTTLEQPQLLSRRFKANVQRFFYLFLQQSARPSASAPEYSFIVPHSNPGGRSSRLHNHLAVIDVVGGKRGQGTHRQRLALLPLPDDDNGPTGPIDSINNSGNGGDTNDRQ